MFRSLFSRPRKRSRKITLERLEDRIVLDAAIAAAIDDQQHQQDHHTTDAAAHAGAKTVEQSAQAQNAPTQAACLAIRRAHGPSDPFIHQNLNQVLVTNAPDVIKCVFGTDSGEVAHDAVHVLVVSSAVQSADQLVQAAGDGVLTVLYNAQTDSPDSILAKIQTTLAGQKADSIAFANHELGAGQFYLTKGYTIDSSSLMGSADLQHFWQGVGLLVKDDGRIDLLACGLVSTEAGNLLLSQLESMTGKNFAASDDPTGNPQSGGDWVLESDGVNVGRYVLAGLSQYNGLLASYPVAVGDTVAVNEDGTLTISVTGTDMDNPAASYVSFEISKPGYPWDTCPCRRCGSSFGRSLFSAIPVHSR